MGGGQQLGPRCGKVSPQVAAYTVRQHEDGGEELQVVQRAHSVHRVGPCRGQRLTHAVVVQLQSMCAAFTILGPAAKCMDYWAWAKAQECLAHLCRRSPGCQAKQQACLESCA
jgi:hypothetical protein